MTGLEGKLDARSTFVTLNWIGLLRSDGNSSDQDVLTAPVQVFRGNNSNSRIATVLPKHGPTEGADSIPE